MFRIVSGFRVPCSLNHIKKPRPQPSNHPASPKKADPRHGVLLVRKLGFYMNYNEEAKSLTFWRGSEVSQEEVSRCEDDPVSMDFVHCAANLRMQNYRALAQPL